MTVLFVVLVGGASVLVAVDRVRAVTAADTYVASGAATVVESADGRVDGAACDALGSLPGVRAAGAIRADTDGIVPSVLPRTTIPAFTMTPGFARIVLIDGRRDAGGLVVSETVADDLAVHPAAQLPSADFPTSLGRSKVQGVYAFPDDGRDPALNYAVLMPTIPDGQPFDACWATVWPESADVAAALGRVVLPAADDDAARPTLGQLNTRLGASFADPSSIPRGLAAGGAFTSGFALGVSAVLRRRLVLASDRHVGVTLGAQAGSQLVQAAVWIAGGLVFVAPIVVAVVRTLGPGDAVPVVAESGIVAAVGALAGAAGTIVGVLLVRERALFRYYKQR